MITKLVSMTDFVFYMRNQTTSGLCKSHPKNFTMPCWNGSQSEMVNGMITIDAIQWKLTGEYAKFLRQPLTLGMFVPCDEKENIYIDYKQHSERQGTICEPYEGLFEVHKRGAGVRLLNGKQAHPEDQRYYDSNKYSDALIKYGFAKSKVLFQGFEIETDMHHSTKREIIWLKKPISKVFLKLSFYNGDIKESFMPDDNIKTVEDLLKYDLALTESALKNIYG